MQISAKLKNTTVFVGCGFAAKYRLGGGNFSVPLQWMLGLRRMGVDAIWLEHFPATDDPESDALHLRDFERHLQRHGLADCYCLLYHCAPAAEHELGAMQAHGLSMADLEARLGRSNLLLNLCNSIHEPLLQRFERRVFCDLDPGEVSYWMSRMEMGQSSHDAFFTIGLNLDAPDCTAAKGIVPWKTFYPLADTVLFQPQPRPARSLFTTVTQWYWKSYLEINGDYPDLSKQAAFAPYLELPARVPGAEMELAVNLNPDDPERERLLGLGWKLVHSHEVAPGPEEYRAYIAGALAEFTPGKRLHALWRTGWLSDRAASFMASGRPIITDDTGAARYLPPESGALIVSNLEEAREAVERVMKDWDFLAARARETAVEYFDSVKNLERILQEVV